MAQKIETTTIYTEKQMDYLNKMRAVCERAKELKETCVGYVIAGYDDAGEGYCYWERAMDTREHHCAHHVFLP